MSSPRQQLVEMAQGFFRGKVLCAAVRLGLAEALADGPLSAEQLGDATHSDPTALGRLLRALASFGVVKEIEPMRFELTELGQGLRPARASILFWADLLADSWSYLPQCVQTGDRSGAEAAREKEGVPSRWAREPEAEAIFHGAFGEPGPEDYSAVIAAYDFSGARRVADLGGGGGGLLAAILQAHPQLKGWLVDRPPAAENARQRFEATGLGERAEALVGDLLEAVPEGADLYTMKSVLHGMLDDRARVVLANCRRVMNAEGRLLLIEIVLPDQVVAPDRELENLLMADLNMLAVTGGLERSQIQWRELLQSAGFSLERVLPAGGCSILECRPV